MYILRGRAPRSGLGMVVVLLWLGVMTWQYPYGVAMFIGTGNCRQWRLVSADMVDG